MATRSRDDAEWQDLFKRHKCISPAIERDHTANNTSYPVNIVIKSVSGITSSDFQDQQADVEFQVSVSFYDTAYHHFFGKPWLGPKVFSKGGKLNYNKSIYFHSSINSMFSVLILEVVQHKTTAEGQPYMESFGWGFLRPFGTALGITEEKVTLLPKSQRIQLFHGTPRALYFLDEPLEGNQLLKTVDKCELSVSVSLNKAMLPVIHLLPENTLVDSFDPIPGIVESPGADKLQSPQLEPVVPVLIDSVVVELGPQLGKFEEEFCEMVNQDRPFDSSVTTVLERRLQVGVHNGWCYVEKPTIFHLETLVETPAKTSLSGSNVRNKLRHTGLKTGNGLLGVEGSSSRLILKNPVNISELIHNRLCSVIFTLEYVIGEIVTSQAKKVQSVIPTHTRTVNVRWASWCPWSQPEPQTTLTLLGGPLRSPSELMVYQGSGTRLSAETSAISSQDFLSFSWHGDSEKLASAQAGLPVPSPRVARLLDRSDNHASFQSSFDRSPVISKPVRAAEAAGDDVMEASSVRAPQHLHPQRSIPSMVIPQQMAHLGYLPQQMAHMGYVPTYEQYNSGLQPLNINHLHEMTDVSHQNLLFTPVHSLIHPKVVSLGREGGLSRAAYARLYAAGFPPLLDRHGEAPVVIEPYAASSVSLSQEPADSHKAQEIVFQFLAYTREPITLTSRMVPTHQPATVFFSFQFYRFPTLTSGRLLMSKLQNDLSANPFAAPFILQRLNQDGSVMEGPPGLEVRYWVDPSCLTPGEITLFSQHLSQHKLHIDVWDGDSLLLIGSCSVDLKYLIRGKNEAVQTTLELDIISTEYQDDSGALTGHTAGTGAVHPVGVNSLSQGRLHLRMGNIGHPVDKSGRASWPASTRNLVVVSQTVSGPFHQDSGSTRILHGTKKLLANRAKHLSENREVASLLFLEQKKEHMGNTESGPLIEGDFERQRKLARFQAVSSKELGDQDSNKTLSAEHSGEKVNRRRDYKTMDIYRAQTKHEGIVSMLLSSITTEHVIFPSVGTVEFFEFALRNPFNQEETFSIEMMDPDLQLITDTREWRHYKNIHQLNTPFEEGMFTSDKSKPQIFLRAQETVYIPFKFLTFKVHQAIETFMGPSDQFTENLRPKLENKLEEARMTKVFFRSEAGKAVAILNLRVEPQPHVVHQVLRFYHPENSFLKKSVRLPPFSFYPATKLESGSDTCQVFVRSNDPSVILDCKPTHRGEPHDIFLKVAVGASPQIKSFLVCVYTDPFLSRPNQIWQCYVHAQQRVDVTCTEGQNYYLTLLIKGTRASRLVRCYTSHPEEIQLAPQDPFILAAGTNHELSVAVKPLRTGSKFFYLNVVDTEYHQLVQSWLLCSTCRSPIVSRAFELTLPVGGGKNSNKRITYTNPYPMTKKFFVSTDRHDLLRFKENIVEIASGATQPIGLCFMPVTRPAATDIMVFINDEEDKNEETFRIKVTYKFMQ